MIATPTFPDLSALVVDESIYIRRIVRDMFMRVGIKRVLEAPDGAEALGVLAESKPDLTILDWDLAILSGEEFIRLARSVYFENDERARIKKDINLALGSSYVEEKSYQDYRAPSAT